MKKAFSGIILALLLTGMITFAFHIRPVKASGAIFIKSWGVVDPPTAPILRNGNLYTLTDNIICDNDGIIIERDNIILEGAGYTLQGTGGWIGISFWDRNNVTIKNITINQFWYGIEIGYSKNNRISRNNITANGGSGIELIASSNNAIVGNRIMGNDGDGIWLSGSSSYNNISGNTLANNWRGMSIFASSHNSISGNNITENNGHGVELFSSSYSSIVGNSMTRNAWSGAHISGSSDSVICGNNVADNNCGISLESSFGNVFYHNSFINNVQQVSTFNSMNVWDDDYPSGGNYWSDYMGLDSNNDGIGDTPYVIDSGNIDRYPHMNGWASTVYLHPSTLTTQAGTTFTLSIIASHIRNLWAWQVGIQWDPAVLEYVSYTWGEFRAFAGASEQSPPIIDATGGMASRPASENASMSGIPVSAVEIRLMTVTFKAIQAGTSRLKLIDLSLKHQNLTDVRMATVGAYVQVQPSEIYISVPYHRQPNNFFCGPAALEMLFDFYGPDIRQSEIASVARTTTDGTYTFDMIRAAHFSNMSSTVLKGYTARGLGYGALECWGMTIDDLKSLILAGYPIIVLTTWHFRVAVGYNSTHITFQDSYYGPMTNMTYSAFISDWDYSAHWGLLVSPWNVKVSNIRNVLPGDVFDVTATITYPCVPPFPKGQYPASVANATITLPDGLTLVPSETAEKTVGTGYLEAGDSVNVTWTVQANSLGKYAISVEAEGKVNGFVPPIPEHGFPEYSYEDRIGGSGQNIVVVTSSLDVSPPTTIDDYNGLWHNQNFKINLTAEDDITGAMETYYRINGAPVKTLSLDGQPYITTVSANNTLEYWSVDWAGNEEFSHKFLSEIKIDKAAPMIGIPLRTPDGEVEPSQEVKVKVDVADALSGVKEVMLFYTVNNGVTWESRIMDHNIPGFYETTILGQSTGTLVKFAIFACDQAGNIAIADNFGEYYTYQVRVSYELTIITTYGGTTNPSPDTYYYLSRTVIDVTATILNSRYTFAHWLLDGDDVGSDNSYTVMMDNNHTLIAIFSYAPVPVGGYSVSIGEQVATNPLMLYLTIATILSTVFIWFKRKRRHNYFFHDSKI